MIEASVPDAEVVRTQFARDVARSLRRTPRQLPSKYFYDPLGSALFEAICHLPWYRITRAETALLTHHAREMLEPFGQRVRLAELGSGSGEKFATLVEHSGRRFESAHLVDISSSALAASRHRLEGLPVERVVTHQTSYEDGLAALERDRDDGALVLLFLGSNIGNFDAAGARELLQRMRTSLRPGDALLLGTDLVKPEPQLLLAYDDPLQVTAAFNRNILRRINDELGGTFDLDGFAHRAVWNVDRSRIEMHLVSQRPQNVRIEAADLSLSFGAGDWIWTESSYKYQADAVARDGVTCGFRRAVQWVDADAQFAITRFDV